MSTTVTEALRSFMGAAYPVSTDIDPRGYRWSEVYLDQARSAALAAAEAQPTETDAEKEARADGADFEIWWGRNMPRATQEAAWYEWCGIRSNSQPSSAEAQPVQEPAGWLLSGSLVYRLTDDRWPVNRDEIRVTMADGLRSEEACAKRAGELFDVLAAAPPRPVGEPVARMAVRAAVQQAYMALEELQGPGFLIGGVMHHRIGLILPKLNEAIDALAAPLQPNLACKSVQARLAAQWGYVPAQPVPLTITDEQIKELILRTVYEGDASTPHRDAWAAEIGIPFARAVLAAAGAKP